MAGIFKEGLDDNARDGAARPGILLHRVRRRVAGSAVIIGLAFSGAVAAVEPAVLVAGTQIEQRVSGNAEARLRVDASVGPQRFMVFLQPGLAPHAVARRLTLVRPLMKQQVVFIDVDDTLVRSIGTKRIPMPAVVSQVRRLHAGGALLFLWSSGGADYCRDAAVELGLSDYFSGYLPKPTTYIDDQPVHEWRDCQHFYPMQAAES